MTRKREGKPGLPRRLAYLLFLAAAASALGAGAGFAAVGQTVQAGNLIITVEGGFTPKRLPAKTPAPITLQAKSTLRTVDGSHLPAAKTLSLDFDKHASLNTRGLPACSVNRLKNTLTKQAEQICAGALIGTGRAGAEISFPEQAPFFASGRLLLFNGPRMRGHRILIFHVYAHVPAPTTFVTTADVEKASGGTYGTRVLIKIPTIVAGQGSLTFAELRMRKTWVHKGRTQHLLLATCPTGRFITRGNLSFADGTQISGRVIKSCSPIR